MKTSRISGIVFLMMVLLPACHRCKDASNPECSNYNPCNGQQKTSAHFVIYQQPSSGIGQYYLSKWTYYDVDSVIPEYVLFKADITNAQSYEWHIGAGVYNTDTVSLSFMGVAPGTIIPITLILKRTPNTQCFPGDNGVDTFTRNMVIVPFATTNRLLGNYIGYYTDAPGTTVNFNFYLGQDSGQPPGTLIPYVSSNTFPNNKISYGGFESSLREFVFGPGVDYDFDCLLYTDSTGLTTIYTETWQQVPPTQKTFIGRKN